MGDHTPEEVERRGPTGSYYQCTDCGRSENTVEELESRPCREGISVKE